MSLLTRLLPNAIFGTDSAHTKHGEKNICTETPPPQKNVTVKCAKQYVLLGKMSKEEKLAEKIRNINMKMWHSSRVFFKDSNNRSRYITIPKPSLWNLHTLYGHKIFLLYIPVSALTYWLWQQQMPRYTHFCQPLKKQRKSWRIGWWC